MKVPLTATVTAAATADSTRNREEVSSIHRMKSQIDRSPKKRAAKSGWMLRPKKTETGKTVIATAAIRGISRWSVSRRAAR